MGPRPNALLLSGLCRRVGSEDSKALFFLLDLASGWSANLTTFSQAIPSAYNAPTPPRQNKSPRNKSSHSFSYEVLHVPVRFGACSRSLLSWCDYSRVLLYQGDVQPILAFRPSAPRLQKTGKPRLLSSSRLGPATYFA